jgi:streptogramin lyase
MRSFGALSIIVLLLVGCGGGEEGGGGDGDVDVTTPAGEFDPDAVSIFVAQGSSVSRVDPAGGETVELLGDLSNCFETWFLDGSLWVACSEGRLLRLDPDTGEVQLDAETGSFVEEIAVDDTGIWVLNGQLGIATELNKLDPATGDVVATVTPETGAFYEDIEVGEGAVWAVGGSAETLTTLVRIDPDAAIETHVFDTPILPARVVAGYGTVWVVGTGFLDAGGGGDNGLHVVGLDPDTGDVSSNVLIGEIDGFPDVALAFDSVWVTDTPAGELVRVDDTGEEIEARIPVGSGGQDLFEIDVAKGLVWAANPFEGDTYGVDPTSNELETGLEGAGKGVAFAP